MRTIEVNVTQGDIDNGARFSCWACPAALAIRRATGDDFVMVRGAGMTIHSQTYSLPNALAAFVLTFDHGYPVSPFTFTLEIE